MSKNIIVFFVILLVLSFGLIGCNMIQHESLTSDNVEKITVNYIDSDGELAERNMSEDEIVIFLYYYNRCSSIRNNKEFAGMATLKTFVNVVTNTENKAASILDSGEDFEIQTLIGGKVASYWAKQGEIDKYLKKISIPSDGVFGVD